MKNYLLPVPFLAALALFAACERQELREAQTAVYAPTAAGMTLQFETFEPENEIQPNDRLQLRVLRTKCADGGLEVAYNISTMRGTADVALLCQHDGGVFQVGADGSKDVQLPPGFPFKTTSWQTNSINYQVLGRARANLAGIGLRNSTGVWIEAIAASPQLSPPLKRKARMLLLPGIGEAETRVLHNGNWVTVGRLVGVGAAAEPI